MKKREGSIIYRKMSHMEKNVNSLSFSEKCILPKNLSNQGLNCQWAALHYTILNPSITLHVHPVYFQHYTNVF